VLLNSIQFISYIVKGSYREVTAAGRATIDHSIETLGFKPDERIYIRPVYPRDEASEYYFYGTEWVVIDGNHRLDWWNRTPTEDRPATLKCGVFRGKASV
jgi:hypothetical protein